MNSAGGNDDPFARDVGTQLRAIAELLASLHQEVAALTIVHDNGREVFHLDAWCNGKGRVHPGIVPYGPWKKERDTGVGPWDKEWPNPTLHPPINEWPGNERWFENRNAPMTAEFTIHQNIVYTAAAFGWLCGPAEKPKSPR